MSHAVRQLWDVFGPRLIGRVGWAVWAAPHPLNAQYRLMWMQLLLVLIGLIDRRWGFNLPWDMTIHAQVGWRSDFFS